MGCVAKTARCVAACMPALSLGRPAATRSLLRAQARIARFGSATLQHWAAQGAHVADGAATPPRTGRQGTFDAGAQRAAWPGWRVEGRPMGAFSVYEP